VTVARWDVKVIGVTVAEAVLRRLRGTADVAPMRVMLESELVLRESCAPPRGRRRR
jgi:DNA-binding LacI/PurR family transcriptional regulator